jgi:hypothetical protein
MPSVVQKAVLLTRTAAATLGIHLRSGPLLSRLGLPPLSPSPDRGVTSPV